jgi:hypothetical protein
MALTITPAVSGAQRYWVRDVGLFYLGSALGCTMSILVAAACVGTVAAVSGRRAALITACLVASLGLLRDVGFPAPVPYRHRQVPAEWRQTSKSSARMSFAYGIALGVGFLTLFTSSVHLVFIALAPFSSLPVISLSVVAYGFGKTLPLLVGAGTKTNKAVLDTVVACGRGRAGVRTRRLFGVGVTSLIIAAAIHVPL